MLHRIRNKIEKTRLHELTLIKCHIVRILESRQRIYKDKVQYTLNEVTILTHKEIISSVIIRINSNTRLKTIHRYPLTSISMKDETEVFYEDVSKIIEKNNHYNGLD